MVITLNTLHHRGPCDFTNKGGLDLSLLFLLVLLWKLRRGESTMNICEVLKAVFATICLSECLTCFKKGLR